MKVNKDQTYTAITVDGKVEEIMSKLEWEEMKSLLLRNREEKVYEEQLEKVELELEEIAEAGHMMVCSFDLMGEGGTWPEFPPSVPGSVEVELPQGPDMFKTACDLLKTRMGDQSYKIMYWSFYYVDAGVRKHFGDLAQERWRLLQYLGRA